MQRTSTAMLLAAATVRQARDAGDRQAQRDALLARACLEGCGRPGARLLAALDSALGRAGLDALESLYLPGIVAHYAWRKRRIRAWALQACADGARQVLALGAGFDALSLRLLERTPGLRAFEIERGPNLAIKRAALARTGLQHPRLSLVEADLGAVAVDAALQAAPGFDPQRPTLVVAEGVLMYLARPELRRLLDGLARALPRARLVATAMSRPAAGGAPGFVRQRPWARRWLERAGEPFRWGETRAGLAALLGECALQLECIADPDEAGDPDPSPGEWLFCARFAG